MEQDLNDVVVFARVVDTGSFTAAADALGLPKSTVSRRISRLEDHLGVRLLQRTTRKLGLTDAGRIFYDRSMRIVSEWEDAARAVTEMQEIPRGRLRVTAPVEIGPRLSETIFEFLREYPEVQLDLDLTNRYVNMVEEGYDVAIRGGELTDSSLIARKLDESNVLLVASPDYLERCGTPEQPEDLREHECIIFASRTTHATWTLQSARGTIYVRVKGRIAVNHLDMLRNAAVAGFGIAQLPAMACHHEIADGQLVEILQGSGIRTGGLSLVYPSTRHLAPKVRAFLDFLLEHYPESPEATASAKTSFQ